MGKVLAFKTNKRHIRRLAEREIENLYRASAGGHDPLVDMDSQELFLAGHIDEPRRLEFGDYAVMILLRLWEG